MKKTQVSQQQRTRLQVPTFRCPGSLFLASELFFSFLFFPAFGNANDAFQRPDCSGLLLWPLKEPTGLRSRRTSAAPSRTEAGSNKQANKQKKQQKIFVKFEWKFWRMWNKTLDVDSPRTSPRPVDVSPLRDSIWTPSSVGRTYRGNSSGRTTEGISGFPANWLKLRLFLEVS